MSDPDASPRTSVERFARMSAVLARCHHRRDEVLRDAGLTSAGWADLRKLWRERMVAVAKQFGAAFKQAQQELDAGLDARIVANPAAASGERTAATVAAPIRLAAHHSPWARRSPHPASAAATVNSTSEVRAIADPVLPFDEPATSRADAAPPSPSPPAVAVNEPHGQLGETAHMQALELDDPIPFDALSERGRALLSHRFAGGWVTVSQLAAVSVEVDEAPQRREQVLAHYRLNVEQYERLQQAQRDWVAADHDARDAWVYACKEYRRWRAEHVRNG